MATDKQIQDEAHRLLDTLKLDHHGLSYHMVGEAGGHDARMELIDDLLSLARCVALDVMNDMGTVAYGYKVCDQTGDAPGHNGEPDEERALAYHLYATGTAAGRCMEDIQDAKTRFKKAWAKADKAPHKLTAEEYLRKISKLK